MQQWEKCIGAVTFSAWRREVESSLSARQKWSSTKGIQWRAQRFHSSVSSSSGEVKNRHVKPTNEGDTPSALVASYLWVSRAAAVVWGHSFPLPCEAVFFWQVDSGSLVNPGHPVVTIEARWPALPSAAMHAISRHYLCCWYFPKVPRVCCYIHLTYMLKFVFDSLYTHWPLY